MNIKFITGNKRKFQEVEKLIKPFKIAQLKIDLDEIQDIDPEKIMKHKLKEAFKHHSGPFIIEDESVTLDCLGGKLPGPLIKWFNDYLGTKGISNLAKKMKNNKASSFAYIALAKNFNDIKFFIGKVKGKIVSPQGSYKFGYDQIFMPDGSKQTFSQMKTNNDFTKSPRGIAVKKLKNYLRSKKHK